MKNPKIWITLSLLFTLIQAEENNFRCKNRFALPSIWEIRLQYARTLTFALKIDEAEVQYKKLIANKKDFIQAQIDLFNLYLEIKKDKEALALLKTIPITKLDSLSVKLAAELASEKHQFAEAGEFYEIYLRRHPLDLNARLNLATIYCFLGDPDKAEKEYLFLLKKRPNDIQLRRNYGFFLIKQRKYQQAVKELKQTL